MSCCASLPSPPGARPRGRRARASRSTEDRGTRGIMAGLSIEGARKSFGATEVLKDMSIDVADGEFTVIVGPSGCGKSTLLRAVAGLEELTAGRIVLGARDVTSLAPSQRGIAMVFQSYALYPHLTVYENLAFGLKIAQADKVAIDAAEIGRAHV